MAPIRNYTNWNQRATDSQQQLEPYRRYYFICEGANTEAWYFKRLIDKRKDLGIHPMIQLCLMEKTGEERSISYPNQLVILAEEQESDLDPQRDKIIIVFDADIFENKSDKYNNIIERIKENNFIPAISNPSFELFLLLHIKDSYKTDILPNEKDIILNKKIGNKRFIYNLLLNRTGINSKSNCKIGELADNFEIAYEQEKNINENINNCKGKLTCNIAKIIDNIRKEWNPIDN